MNLYGPSMTMAVVVLISLPIEALLVWRLALAFGATTRFLTLFSLMAHVYLVGRLGNLLSYFLSKGRQALEPPDGCRDSNSISPIRRCTPPSERCSRAVSALPSPSGR